MDFRGKNIDLVGKWKLWLAISTLLVIVGMVAWAAFGLNYGVDFKGGGQLQYRIPVAARPAPGQEASLLNSVREGLGARGLRGAKIQVAGGDTLVIQTDARSTSELQGQERAIREVVAPQFKAAPTADALQPIGRQLVGPVIGEELRSNAVKGVLIGVALIALWIYIRYNFAGDGTRYAIAGIVALVHDVLVLIGIFSIIGRIDPRVEVDGAFIAALLTVVGYSINDSVVIFDRLRENLRQRRKEPFDKVVNDSLLETMSRSVNTGLTVIIMLLALLFLGGESIYNFVLAMIIGIVSGLYSSIFNASMVLIAWNKWEESRRATARASRPTGRAATARTGVTTGTSSTSRGAAAPARGGLAAAGLAAGGASAAPTISKAPTVTATPVATAATATTAPTHTPRVTGDAVSGPVTVVSSTITSGSAPEPAGEAVSIGLSEGADDVEADGDEESDGGVSLSKQREERVARPSQKARAKRRF